MSVRPLVEAGSGQTKIWGFPATSSLPWSEEPKSDDDISSPAKLYPYAVLKSIHVSLAGGHTPPGKARDMAPAHCMHPKENRKSLLQTIRKETKGPSTAGSMQSLGCSILLVDADPGMAVAIRSMMRTSLPANW